MKTIWLIAFLLFVLCLALVGCQKAPFTAAATVKSAEESVPGLLPVKVSGKWGYVNRTGQLVVNPQVDYADAFFMRDEQLRPEEIAAIRKMKQ